MLVCAGLLCEEIMNNIHIVQRNGEGEELAKYESSIAPRVGEIVDVLNNESKQYVKHTVIEVSHIVAYGKALVVCYVNPA